MSRNCCSKDSLITIHRIVEALPRYNPCIDSGAETRAAILCKKPVLKCHDMKTLVGIILVVCHDSQCNFAHKATLLHESGKELLHSAVSLNMVSQPNPCHIILYCSVIRKHVTGELPSADSEEPVTNVGQLRLCCM